MDKSPPKISFAYPTFVKPGMGTTGVFTPDIGCELSEFPSKLSLYVTAGLLLNSLYVYSFDIDVFFNGRSLIPNNTPAVDTQLIGTSVSSRDDFVALSTTLLPEIEAPSEGVYTVRVLLYTGDTHQDNRNLIEEYDCYFVVAKQWISNEMKQMD